MGKRKEAKGEKRKEAKGGNRKEAKGGYRALIGRSKEVTSATQAIGG